MINIKFTLLVLAVTLLALESRSIAQDDPDDGASSVLAKLSPRETVLLNAARWLSAEKQNVKGLDGIQRQPCLVPPLSSGPSKKMSLLETVRLWGVLETGWVNDELFQPHVDSFLKSKPFKTKNSLAPLAVQMLCAMAVKRTGLADVKKVNLFMKKVWRASEKLTAPTAKGGPWFKDDKAEPEWFSNVYWRAVLVKAAILNDIAEDSKTFASDIELLETHAGKYSSEFLPESSDKPVLVPAHIDMHNNFCGFAAIAVANEFPDLFTDELRSQIKSRLAKSKSVLRNHCAGKWGSMGNSSGRGARGIVMLAVAEDPRALTVVKLEDWIVGVNEYCQQPSGQIYGSASLCEDLGLADGIPDFNFDHAALIETALMVPAVTGGLFAKERKTISALEPSVVQDYFDKMAENEVASSRPKLVGSLEKQIEKAVKDGAAYIVSTQIASGVFSGPSDGSAYLIAGSITPQVFCLRALLASGYERESDPVKLGIGYLESRDWGLENGTAGSAADVLLFFQAYYLAELEKSGMKDADTPSKYAKARKAMWESVSESHRSVIEKLVKRLDSFKLGSYRGSPNNYLLASQAAMVGYKSALLLGTEVSEKVFKEEAKRLISMKLEVSFLDPAPVFSGIDLKKPVDIKVIKKLKTVKPVCWAYTLNQSLRTNPELTEIGIECLTICLDELRLRGKLDKKLETEIEETIAGALATVSYYAYDLETANELWGDLSETAHGYCGVFLNMYRYGRACRQAKAAYLGGTLDWHKNGSKVLILLQAEYGGWAGQKYDGQTADGNKKARGHVITTSMAILFLKSDALPMFADQK